MNFLTSPSSYRVQKTLRRTVSFKGVGLHTGKKSTVRLTPAPPNHGVLFERADLVNHPRIYAHYDAVVATSMATSLGLRDEPSVRISTVEHILSALYGTGITNVLIEVEGPEVPILDGSAAPFLQAFEQVGLELQAYSAPILRILKPIKIYQNEAVCELLPRDRLRLTTSIDFPHPLIGLQTFALELTPKEFQAEVSAARTFGFLSDFEKLKAAKLAQGASLENVLAFSDDSVLNPEGSRFADECVRHKCLDAIGDLALCGAWICGELVSFRGGHSIHLALLHTLKDHKSHWELIPASPLPHLALANPTHPSSEPFESAAYL